MSTLDITVSDLQIGSLFSGYGGLDMGVIAALADHGIAARVAWHVEFSDEPSRILAYHHPDLINYGDITAVDWGSVPPVQVLTGGFPCQDISLAGKRAGLQDGTRSGLWSEFARAIDVLRPELVVIENVRGLLSATASKGDGSDICDGEDDSDLESGSWSVGELDRGSGPVLRALGAVLGDLAVMGFDAEWCGVRASDAGAPHARYRIFVLAWPADAENFGRSRRDASEVATGEHGQPGDTGRPAVENADESACGERGQSAPGEAEGGRARPDAGRRGGAPAANANGGGLGALVDHVLGRQPDPRWCAAADASRERRREGRAESAGSIRRSEVVVSSSSPVTDTSRDESERWGAAGNVAGSPGTGESDRGHRERYGDAVTDPGIAPTAWGEYWPAVDRWERVTGRRAPAPTRPDGKNGAHRLSPLLTEWMMGLPLGHVTDPPIWVGMSSAAARNAQLKACGNGVVPQQARLGVGILLARCGSLERVA